MSETTKGLDGETFIDGIIDAYNEAALTLIENMQRQELVKKRFPHLADSEDFLFRDGKNLGQRELLLGFKASIMMVLAESSPDSPFGDIHLTDIPIEES